MRGQEHKGWDVQAHLTASLIDAVNHNTWAFVTAHSKKKVPVPEPLRRPGDADRKPKNNTFAATVARLVSEAKAQRKG